jgi:hypothetical protein
MLSLYMYKPLHTDIESLRNIISKEIFLSFQIAIARNRGNIYRCHAYVNST